MVAFLLHEHALTLAEFADLTDWQIEKLYLHARDDEGRIEMAEEGKTAAEPSPTLESELIALDRVCAVLRVPTEEVSRKRQELKDKYARMAEGSSSNDGTD